MKAENMSKEYLMITAADSKSGENTIIMSEKMAAVIGSD